MSFVVVVLMNEDFEWVGVCLYFFSSRYVCCGAEALGGPWNIRRNREQMVLDSGGLEPGSFGRLVRPLIVKINHLNGR